MKDIRRAVRDEILQAVGAAPASGARANDAPADGLFPPNSIVRRVHADVTSMMIGGVGSLLLQMLHPSALAGVWDHTDFRRDMPGRLRRTGQFITVTTYGSRNAALGAIARVRSIHERVLGNLPDGAPYCANDPDLLAWVHAAETWCFLRSHVRHREPRLSAEDQDRYFAEMTEVARLLGATSVPASRRETERYLEDMRPRLKWDRRTRRVASELLSQHPVAPALAPFNALIFDAGVDLLPDWAAEMHGFLRRSVERRSTRLRARGAGAILRWAMTVDAKPARTSGA